MRAADIVSSASSNQLGERPSRARLQRLGSRGVVQVRRQHKSRDVAAYATVVDLSHEVQPVAVGTVFPENCELAPRTSDASHHQLHQLLHQPARNSGEQRATPYVSILLR